MYFYFYSRDLELVKKHNHGGAFSRNRYDFTGTSEPTHKTTLFRVYNIYDRSNNIIQITHTTTRSQSIDLLQNSKRNMMCDLYSLEPPKKARSVRFNDNALETIVSYDTDMEEYQFNYNDHEEFPNELEVAHNTNDSMRLYRRSGSHELLYDKISIETASMNPRLLKKRSSDLDDSNHFSISGSSHSYRNATFDMDAISSNRFSGNSHSSHHRSFVSSNGGLNFSSRGGDDNDLDVSHHNRQQRHYNKRVMCV